LDLNSEVEVQQKEHTEEVCQVWLTGRWTRLEEEEEEEGKGRRGGEGRSLIGKVEATQSRAEIFVLAKKERKTRDGDKARHRRLLARPREQV
jgi:hypothetical protein